MSGRLIRKENKKRMNSYLRKKIVKKYDSIINLQLIDVELSNVLS
jgi:hypothetical protein